MCSQNVCIGQMDYIQLLLTDVQMCTHVHVQVHSNLQCFKIL